MQDVLRVDLLEGHYNLPHDMGRLLLSQLPAGLSAHEVEQTSMGTLLRQHLHLIVVQKDALQAQAVDVDQVRLDLELSLQLPPHVIVAYLPLVDHFQGYYLSAFLFYGCIHVSKFSSS